MGVVDQHVNGIIGIHLKSIGRIQDSDVLLIFSPITYGLDHQVKVAVESIDNDQRKNKLTIILDTNGGVIEVVERMVNTIRYFYGEVDFIIPDRAMSAGTVFALSADNIFMNYYSYLGPIDPQIQVGDTLKPALGYLAQYERLVKKAENGALTEADALLLNKLDLADLYLFEQAREHSVELLEEWLSTYKFKNWTITETAGDAVNEEKRRARAKDIAQLLNDSKRWHSHGRGINMQTAKGELKLRILDFDENKELGTEIRHLTDLVLDYTGKTANDVFVKIAALNDGRML